MTEDIIRLREKLLSALRENSGNFRHCFEITKTGDPRNIDEITYKKLQLNQKMKLHIMDTFDFLGQSYNDGTIKDTFIFHLVKEILGADIRNNNVSVEGFCHMLRVILPKIAVDWTDANKEKIIEAIKVLNCLVLTSNDYSSRVKDIVNELFESYKLRFHCDVTEEKGKEESFSLYDLRKLSTEFVNAKH